MDFNNIKENLIDSISKIVDGIKNDEADKEIFSYYCPYCEYGVNDKQGYVTCEGCGNNYRIYKKNVYKDEETINDVVYYFIKIIAHISKANEYISDEKLDYVYYLAKEEIKLNSVQRKWCAVIFKETEKEVYTSELVDKFKNSLKKYYCDNYNIERLSVLRWMINLVNMDLYLYEKQEKIINDYSKAFNIREIDYAYINCPEVSISRE